MRDTSQRREPTFGTNASGAPTPSDPAPGGEPNVRCAPVAATTAAWLALAFVSLALAAPDFVRGVVGWQKALAPQAIESLPAQPQAGSR